MAQDWDIRPRSILCSECENAFENNETYYSALVHGADGYQRGDFCVGCWVGKEAELQPYSAWKGIFVVPVEKPDTDPLKKETAESLLRRLIEDESDENAPVIYILTIMLERKKTLVEKDVKIDEDGTMHRVYEHRQTGETFIVLDPRLKLDKLESVQIRVADMLGGTEKKAGEESQTSEGGEQRAEGESQEAENRSQMSEDGDQTSADEGQEAEGESSV